MGVQKSWIPPRYFSCHSFGHLDNNYLFRDKEKVWRPKEDSNLFGDLKVAACSSLEAVAEDEIARSKGKAIHVDDSAGDVSGAKSHDFVNNENGDGRQVSYPKKVRVASQGVSNLMKAMKSKKKGHLVKNKDYMRAVANSWKGAVAGDPMLRIF
ncbi:hypothetical protein Godav_001310 [Gossypium davidsonii]|uniref:Uncharacterized protein n=1 Tax=Gossypium davidsonii TaxID=34287 RepID=A0A7J8T2L9_GOSDV|nr:hypothetical protein [Gossypium davidsonii]